MRQRAPGEGLLFVDRPAAERRLAAPESDLGNEEKKRDAFVRLRDRYEEARRLVSSREPHENLEWILGARRNAIQDPLGLQAKTVELIALWLQDLSHELDRRLEGPPSGDLEDRAVSAAAARRSGAERLREATETFLAAFLPACPS